MSNSVLQCAEAAGALESHGHPLRVSHSQCNPNHQQHPDHCHPWYVLGRVMGRAHLNLGVSFIAVKGEPDTFLKPYSLQNTDREGKDPPHSFRFRKLAAFSSDSALQYVLLEREVLTPVRRPPSLPVCQREKLVNVKLSRKITAGPWPQRFPQLVLQRDLSSDKPEAHSVGFVL